MPANRSPQSFSKTGMIATTLIGVIVGCAVTVGNPSGPTALGSTPVVCDEWEVRVENIGTSGSGAGTYSGGWEPFATQIPNNTNEHFLTLRRCLD